MCELSLQAALALEEAEMPIQLLARRETGQQQTGEFDFHPSSHNRFIRFLYTQINMTSRKRVNTTSSRSNPAYQFAAAPWGGGWLIVKTCEMKAVGKVSQVRVMHPI